MTVDPILPARYTPILDLARRRGTPFHVTTHDGHGYLHLHLPDGTHLTITDDGVGGATARKPGGATGWQITHVTPGVQAAAVYNSTLLGRYHHLGTDPRPLLRVLNRYLPPPDPQPTPRRHRTGLLRRLLRLT
ncbi:hypothetical protein [Kitasatospora cheerisanensis]|uniref:Uncharacterized protein n=1 Tax=Kitasatospora cheerisanensis KCTC 2395 TaxID=1348663 RepID=A0A066Z0H1_9ACTN|nr:hypothetical protein [Kitasatospora cheerisanensis]KDN85719.1 hypothetical protein KCH_25470 [Kitasatospora cheerisanensis KCTC 2395]